MGHDQKLAGRILSGLPDANIGFDELRALLKGIEFDERIKGSHYCRPVPEPKGVRLMFA
jgi:hypothetical protein